MYAVAFSLFEHQLEALQVFMLEHKHFENLCFIRLHFFFKGALRFRFRIYYCRTREVRRLRYKYLATITSITLSLNKQYDYRPHIPPRELIERCDWE